MMKNAFKITSIVVLLFLQLYAIPYSLYPVYAANPCPVPGRQGVLIGKCFGFGGLTSLGQATSQLVTPTFSIASFLVIIYFLIGAFKYLRAGGNKEELQGARQMITHAMIGFIILIFAFFILQFLLSSLFGVTGFRIF